MIVTQLCGIIFSSLAQIYYILLTRRLCRFNSTHNAMYYSRVDTFVQYLRVRYMCIPYT